MTAEIPEQFNITIWDLFKSTGLVCNTMMWVATVLTIVGVMLCFISKQKQDLGISLITVSVKFCVLSAVLLFFGQFVGIGIDSGRDGLMSCDKQLSRIYQAFVAPTFLFGVAWIAFVLKSILQIKTIIANQGLDPTSANAQSVVPKD